MEFTINKFPRYNARTVSNSKVIKKGSFKINDNKRYFIYERDNLKDYYTNNHKIFLNTIKFSISKNKFKINSNLKTNENNNINNKIIDNKKYNKFNNFPYKVLNILGKGSYASVYKCIDEISNTYYAVKVYDKEKMGSLTKQKLIKNEISILKYLNHSNIIKIHKILESKEYVT